MEVGVVEVFCTGVKLDRNQGSQSLAGDLRVVLEPRMSELFLSKPSPRVRLVSHAGNLS